MSAGNAAGGSADAPNTTRSTLSKKNQAKADKKSKAEANVEMGLGNDRMSNYSRSQGGTKEEGDGGENNNNINNNNNSNITQATKKKSPTVETKVEKAAELTADQIALRNKKRGRSSSIMTSSQGVGKTSSNYELGKTSLLGRV